MTRRVLHRLDRGLVHPLVYLVFSHAISRISRFVWRRISRSAAAEGVDIESWLDADWYYWRHILDGDWNAWKHTLFQYHVDDGLIFEVAYWLEKHLLWRITRYLWLRETALGFAIRHRRFALTAPQGYTIQRLLIGPFTLLPPEAWE